MEKLSILFFMSFSLKHTKTFVIRGLWMIISQSSFSWAFLWNVALPEEEREHQSPSLNPLFHELFSETLGGKSSPQNQGAPFSQSSFSWAFLWNGATLPAPPRIADMNSQSSFSWAFLWNLFPFPPSLFSSLYPLNPLFHELFSETNPYLGVPEELGGIVTLNPLFHELFSETLCRFFLLHYYVVYLSILFFMSFSLKPNANLISIVTGLDRLSILFFMSFSLKRN